MAEPRADKRGNTIVDRELPPRFRLSLLGRFQLLGPDGRIGVPSKKLSGLLAFLACMMPEPQSREKLATLLWGSHFEARARQNLRQALLRLRRLLGQNALVGSGDKISLAPELVSCDVAQFEALIRDGGHHAMAEVVDLYDGRLLSDLSIPQESWSNWLDSERQRLENLALDYKSACARGAATFPNAANCARCC